MSFFGHFALNYNKKINFVFFNDFICEGNDVYFSFFFMLNVFMLMGFKNMIFAELALT